MSDFFLADDLSGALETAAAFHHAGWPVRVVLSPTARGATARGTVLGITTETRNASPVEAAATVTQALALGRAGGGRLLFKKIDSTLRGPVAAEVTALATAMPETTILFSPANPRAGRTVRDGLLLVGGVPVAQTEFGRDPVSPVRESAIRRLLGEVGARLVVPEIETDADLAAAVAGIAREGRAWVAVGSGALARAVAAHQVASPSTVVPALPIFPPGPALMIGGSAHPINRRQIEELVRLRGLSVHEMGLNDPMPAVRAAIASLNASRAAVLVLEPHRGDSRTTLQVLTAGALAAVKEGGVRRVFATGGETAFALCEALGVGALDFVAEIEPGVALASGVSHLGPMMFAVKPGGFGDEQTWVRVFDRLAAG